MVYTMFTFLTDCLAWHPLISRQCVALISVFDNNISLQAAALRGVAIQRGRVGAARATFPTSAAALALARNPGQLAAAAAATALHPFAPAVYYDPFLAAHAATQDPNYRLQAAAAAAAASPLLKTPLSTAQQATYAAAATYTAVAARAYGAAAAAAQPVAGYAAVAGYGREYADPYLGHGIGPVAGYGVRRNFDYEVYFYEFSTYGNCVATKVNGLCSHRTHLSSNATIRTSAPCPVSVCSVNANQQLYTEVATIGSRHTKWIISRTQEPSKLYSAEHDQTRVDTIITVIFVIIEIIHETTSLDPP
ncbi:hypothetical protein ALC56_08786 [Trachymyrmex septentrionalis]|uniref:Uncharacterized protein n=1 Tax=Trachymyrmex septentrionalis TaxID=34720 RepID=A0A195F8R2_9HYME|nr:hypothetical protein ALC56_08786 [Trachymyrmex septentrionalis]